MNTLIQLSIVIVIVITLIIGNHFKTNTGILALVAAYIVGTFVMHLTVSDIIALWPIDLTILLLSVTLFFGYAVENGLLQLMANHIIFRLKRYPKFLPFSIYITCVLLSATGAGAFSIGAFMAPIAFELATIAGMNYILASASVVFGSLVGSSMSWSQGGVIYRGLIAATYPEEAFFYATINGFANAVIVTIIFAGMFFILNGYKCKPYKVEKPKSMNRIQKINLIIIACVMLCIIVSSILSGVFNKNELLAQLADIFDIQMLSFIGAAVCALLKLADERKVIKNQVPWNTILTVCGFSILINMAIETGIIDTIANWMGASVPQSVIMAVLIFISAIMSMFSSTLAVVIPTMVPMLPGIIGLTQLNSPLPLIIAIILGSTMADFSPFSTGGSLVIAGCKNEVQRERLIYQQLLWCVGIVVFCMILAFLGIFNFFAF